MSGVQIPLGPLSNKQWLEVCVKVVQQYQKVNPPVDCYPFIVTFNECKDCGVTFTTTKQRRKNRKNFGQASKKYKFNNSTHGIYY